MVLPLLPLFSQATIFKPLVEPCQYVDATPNQHKGTSHSSSQTRRSLLIDMWQRWQLLKLMEGNRTLGGASTEQTSLGTTYGWKVMLEAEVSFDSPPYSPFTQRLLQLIVGQ